MQVHQKPDFLGNTLIVMREDICTHETFAGNKRQEKLAKLHEWTRKLISTYNNSKLYISSIHAIEVVIAYYIVNTFIAVNF